MANRMTTLDCEDSHSGTGLCPFEPPAIVDVGSRTFRVLLCVHRPHSMMRLYVEQEGRA